MEKRTKRKNFFSSFLAFLVMGVMLIGSLSQIVLAGNYEAGKTGTISLTVQETGDDGTQKPIPNVKLTLYKVGSVSYDGNVHFVADSALQFTGVDFENLKTAEDWYSAAETLSAAVKKIGLTGIEKQSDAQGKIVYSNQQEGMYLIVQDNRDGKVSVSPMLLSVPFAEEGTGWTYDVQAYPKAVTNDVRDRLPLSAIRCPEQMTVEKKRKFRLPSSCFILTRILMFLTWKQMMRFIRLACFWIKMEPFRFAVII